MVRGRPKGDGVVRLNRVQVVGVLSALVLTVSGCGGGEDGTAADATDASPAAPAPEDSATAPAPDEGDTDAGQAQGGGVILADLCAGGQPLNGAVSLEDLVSYGVFTSTDVTIESNKAYDATTYDTFGFICNITEDVGDGQNGLTIGMSSGPDGFQLAVDQGDAPVEKMGKWKVIVGSNWLSPLAMRTTDSGGNVHSLYALWTPADGSIPDAATLEKMMRPLAEAIAERSTVDIPQT